MYNPLFSNYGEPYTYVPTYSPPPAPKSCEVIPTDNEKKEKKKSFDIPSFFSNIKDLINSDDVILNIFGIDLYWDDILILLIILFLYTEGVKDFYLYVALILLLLT